MRILCFLMIMLACLPLRAETITLVADEWCPFTCDPASDPHKPGFLIDIVKAVFEKKGHVVTYRLLPWTRAINDTREGKYAALVGASQADGPDFIFHRTPLSTMQNAFFVKKDNPWRYTGLESLGAVALGATAEYTYGTSIDHYIAQHRQNATRVQLMTGENPLDINIKKLMAGRVGALIEEKKVMAHMLNDLGLANDIIMAGDYADDSQSNLFVAFSPKGAASRAWAEMLDEGIAALKASGELQAILQKYNLPPS